MSFTVHISITEDENLVGSFNFLLSLPSMFSLPLDNTLIDNGFLPGGITKILIPEGLKCLVLFSISGCVHCWNTLPLVLKITVQG